MRQWRSGRRSSPRWSDPEKQRLSQESAKYRTKLRNEEAAHGETKTALADARKLNAFLIAAAGKVTDLDAAWKLCDQTALTVNDDGTITGADDVVAATVASYPYLAPAEPPSTLHPRSVPRKRQAAAGAPRTVRGQHPARPYSEKRFPALKKR